MTLLENKSDAKQIKKYWLMRCLKKQVDLPVLCVVVSKNLDHIDHTLFLGAQLIQRLTNKFLKNTPLNEAKSKRAYQPPLWW